MTYTLIDPVVDQESLYKCAKGCYQEALLDGNEAWSGGTLRGRARSYGYHYSVSRCNLIDRIEKAGMKTMFVFGRRGKKILVIGSITNINHPEANNIVVKSILT